MDGWSKSLFKGKKYYPGRYACNFTEVVIVKIDININNIITNAFHKREELKENIRADTYNKKYDSQLKLLRNLKSGW